MATEKKETSSNDNGDNKEQNILEKAKDALGIQPEQQTLFYTVAGLAGAVLLFFILMIVGFSNASGWKGRYQDLDSGDTAEKLTTAQAKIDEQESQLTAKESDLEKARIELEGAKEQGAEKFREEVEQLKTELETSKGQYTLLEVGMARKIEKSVVALAKLKASSAKALAKEKKKSLNARQLQGNLSKLGRENRNLRKGLATSQKFAQGLAKELQDSKEAKRNLDEARKKVKDLERENQRLSVLAGKPAGTDGQPAGKLSAEEAKEKYNALRKHISGKEQRSKYENNINLIEGALVSLLGTKYGANASKLLNKQVYYATRKRYTQALADTKEMPASNERINALKSALKGAEQIGKTSYTKKLEQEIVTQQNEKKARDLFDPVDARVKRNPKAYDTNLEALDGLVKDVKGTSYAKEVRSLISAQKKAKSAKERKERADAKAAAKKAQAVGN